MRQRPRASINDLRLAIDCLPPDTRVAMLEGIAKNEIIAGAYSDGDGICPMLAAHRNGGRTNFISFARAWDRFAFRGTRAPVARRATDRELLVLRTHLESSLLADEGPASDLADVIAEHRALVSERETGRDGSPVVEVESPERRRSRPGDPDRSRELRQRPGWRWMRVVRSYDDYERLLDVLGSEAETLAQREPEHVS